MTGRANLDTLNRRTPKPHRWVGAFILPLSEDRARELAYDLEHPKPGRQNRVHATRTIPTILDVYCEACRCRFGDAPELCDGIYMGRQRKTA